MKIYILTLKVAYEGSENVALFLNKDDAIALKEKLDPGSNSTQTDGFIIEEWTPGEIKPPWD